MKLFVITPRTQKAGEEVPLRLIRAERRSHVEGHLIGEMNIASATADDAFKAAQQGVQIEDIGEAPAA